MQAILRRSLKLILVAAIALVPASLPVYAQSAGDQSTGTGTQAPTQDPQAPAPAQQPTTDAAKPDASKTDSAKQDPSQTDKQKQDQKKPTGDVPRDTPIQQQDTVHPKNSKQDVDAIGNRKLGGFNMHSLETDIAIGKQYAQEVERSSKLIDDPVVVEYVNRVGQNLVRNSDARVPFTIKVIDSDEVNAFALPGGFFYVNSGLILRATEEAELAGVMAHEISHVTARHGTRGQSRAEVAQLAMIPLILLGPGGWAGYGIYQGLNLSIPFAFLQFSRSFEREADYLGLQYMYKAGYDPNAYITFFERVQADEKRRPGTIPKVFSTHPPTPERIQNAQQEIATILPARDEYIVSTSEFDSVKARLRNIMFSRKAVDNAPGKPTLRTRTEQTDKQKTQTQTSDPNSTDDDRPTLKRRPDSR
ncbi:MAG TPA: M48 family metallopeptidase [Candidatus Acidoferrum sp.]|nr:M48 family metallopeptidase [Candidatus Acidoferrum sp.]